jgi:hypothetical protein
MIEVGRDGIEIVARHPLLGRPCVEGLREMTISYGKRAHVALYGQEQPQDVVLIPALSRQRAAGYSPV